MRSLSNRPPVLVTGLNGVIGWNLFLEARKIFTAYGTYRKEHRRFSPDCFYRIDLESDEAVCGLLKRLCPEILIHSWGICDLDVCETCPEMAARINIAGTERFLKAARENGNVRKFVYISTDHVFSGERGAYAAGDRPDPKHVYGRTKAAAEECVRQSGLPYLIIRPGLVIGESVQGNVGPRDFLLARIRAGKPTHYFVDEWRSPVSGEVFAGEVMAQVLNDAGGTRHIAGSESVNRFDLARRLAGDSGLSPELIFPKYRRDDSWAPIRPRDLSLKSCNSL